MFWHLYKYRLKAMLNSKTEIFWNFVFPILLCTCFVVAFSSINSKAYLFHTIPVAVVYEKDNPEFEATLTAVAKDDSQGEAFMSITDCSADDAKEMLKDNSVDAAIIVGDDISVLVDSQGINQTAIQSFISQYIQKASVIKDIASTNPEQLQTVIDQMSDSTEYIQEASLTDNKIDPLSSYYFSLIAMTALFGSFFGLQCALQMKADTSGVGIRKCICPAGRGKMIIAEFLATYTLQLATMVTLLLYMKFIVRIDMGTQYGYIALTCAVGSLFGVSFGLFVGCIPRLKAAVRDTITVSFSLLSSFLAGLMVSDLKMFLQKNAPAVNMINPATLIQDALYSLLIYNTHERYFLNMIILTAYSVILCVVSLLMTRRESYASI